MEDKKTMTAEQRRRLKSRVCRRATLFAFALAVGYFALVTRSIGPMLLREYLAYMGFWSVLLLPLVVRHFPGARWRLSFFLLFYLCFGVIAAEPYVTDPLVRDVVRIRPGMTKEEARAILAPYIAEGRLSGLPDRPYRQSDGTALYLCQESVRDEINYVHVNFRGNRVEYAGITWDS